MHEKDLQIEPQLEVHKIEPQPKQKPIQSDLTEKYWEIMGKQHLSAQHISTLISKLSSQNISYEPHYFHETIYAKIIDHMPNYHILTLRVAYGYFKITLTIYCQEQESHSHNLSNIGNHQSSSVFVARNGNKSEVIKCYCIENPEQSIHVFGGALKQYFLMRIAQGLGVGPSLIKLGGFDMIMSQKCIEFGMEKCQQIINTQNLSKEMVENLVLNLKIMHTFNLVHVDIKPQNIMYSSIIQQLVYIDFGFSKLIKQKQGLRTKTEFAGTAQVLLFRQGKLLGRFRDKRYKSYQQSNNTRKSKFDITELNSFIVFYYLYLLMIFIMNDIYMQIFQWGRVICLL